LIIRFNVPHRVLLQRTAGPYISGRGGRRASRRKPSNFISWIQSARPVGGLGARLGRHGSMKPVERGSTLRNNMARQWAARTDESSHFPRRARGGRCVADGGRNGIRRNSRSQPWAIAYTVLGVRLCGHGLFIGHHSTDRRARTWCPSPGGRHVCLALRE
jgi:hypothetical protein